MLQESQEKESGAGTTDRYLLTKCTNRTTVRQFRFPYFSRRPRGPIPQLGRFHARFTEALPCSSRDPDKFSDYYKNCPLPRPSCRTWKKSRQPSQQSTTQHWIVEHLKPVHSCHVHGLNLVFEALNDVGDVINAHLREHDTRADEGKHERIISSRLSWRPKCRGALALIPIRNRIERDS